LNKKLFVPSPTVQSKSTFPTWGFALSNKIVNKIKEENQIPDKSKIPSVTFHQIQVKGEDLTPTFDS